MGNRAGEVTLLFGDAERKFRLTPVRWEKVQERCQAGPPEILRRLSIALLPRVPGVSGLEMAAAGRLGQWFVQDIREPIRQGLIGGGMREEDAERLCREFVDDRGLIDSLPTAFEVVKASLFGPEEEPVAGEPEGAPVRRKTRSRTARSASPKSTA